MDFPDAQTPPAPPAGRSLGVGLAVLALALYAALLAWNAGAGAGGSDSSGYMNQARLLAAGRVHVQPRTIPGLAPAEVPPFLYVPLGFKPAPDGNGMVPTYPVGLSLFIVALKPLAGWRYAGDATAILNSLAGLVATFGLARRLGLGRGWALLGAAIVAASPLYLLMSLMAMSDVPSLAWTTLAVLAALRSRDRPAWALAAGAAFAVDVLLRPTNILALLPMAVALGTSPRRWILFGLGGLPGAAVFAAHATSAYGSLLATGYGDATYYFGARYIRETVLHVGLWLPALFTPIVVLSLCLPWMSSVGVRERWLLGTWIVVFPAFYSAYQCTHETWWYLRFLLPSVPAMVVGALLVLRQWHARLSGKVSSDIARRPLAAALLLVLVFSCEASRRLKPLFIARTERQYGQVADWMEKNLPRDAVCVTMQTSGALFYYTHFTFIRWDFVDEGNVGRIESAIRSAKRPMYAALFPFEYNDSHVLDRRLPGHWSEVGTVGDVRVVKRDFGEPKS